MERSAWTVVGMLAAFAAVFAAGFVPRPPNLFLYPLGAFGFGAAALLLGWSAPPTRSSGRRWTVGIGISALLFSAGLVYGAGGFWWHYEVNDVLYVGSVVMAAVAYLVTSVVWLMKQRKERVGRAETGPP